MAQNCYEDFYVGLPSVTQNYFGPDFLLTSELRTGKI